MDPGRWIRMTNNPEGFVMGGQTSVRKFEIAARARKLEVASRTVAT